MPVSEERYKLGRTDAARSLRAAGPCASGQRARRVVDELRRGRLVLSDEFDSAYAWLPLEGHHEQRVERRRSRGVYGLLAALRAIS